MLSVTDFKWDNPRFQKLLSRSTDISPQIWESTRKIVEDVRAKGDEALFHYMHRFDNIVLSPDTLRVSKQEIQDARKSVSDTFKAAVKAAVDNLFAYHKRQLPESYEMEHPKGVILRRRILPIQRVGVCVPSASGPLCSSLMMNVVPALVAGVSHITVVTAPRDGRVDDHILYVADHLGIDNILKISGAQAVAALAYGTESVEKVDKIVGPGNAYVSTAKRIVNGVVGIDSYAGPSEIVVIADESANPRFIAADLLSQAEHGTGEESSVAFVLSEEMGRRVAAEVESLVREYDLVDRVSKALSEYGAIFVVDSIDTAVAATNAIAPEHVEIMVEDDEQVIDGITCAGAIYTGAFSPEPVGDYFCGTNHVLPTNGTARFSSALGVSDFVRSMSIVRYSEEALDQNMDMIVSLAEAEGMRAHALSVRVRAEDRR
ncbi:MAG TPA: histidinol dehydrogenase [Bacillota bacterium]|nr:histidinol dehydrogenase [Bacillota bacterium]HPZ53642.1 histidinol dehydrogenase [Bacillota bacterium]HQD17203.1 histidinol dehydrogenase [Bacillota bacterium]